MRIPKPISKLMESFEKLPGVGPKTASRLTFYMLRVPQPEIESFARALTDLKTGIKLCSICKNVGEEDICNVCQDAAKDKHIIAVVATPMDVLALEKTGYSGTYHVLHGVIDPLNNIGPEEIYIDSLISRLTNMDGEIEVILATNTSMEGESTAMYIQKLIRESGLGDEKVKITRIAR
ncbi:MAG: recombination protein RecR, partial [uncultured bacterium]